MLPVKIAAFHLLIRLSGPTLSCFMPSLPACPAVLSILDYPEQLAGRQVADRLSQVMSPRMLTAGANNGFEYKDFVDEHVRDPRTLRRSDFAAATAAAMNTHREIGSSSDPLIQSQWRVLEDTGRTPSGFSAQ